MLFTRKSISKHGIVIVREQKQLHKERILSNPALVIGLIGFVSILAISIIIPSISNVDPNAMSVSNRFSPPSNKHYFGTDEFGRDIFIRLMYGSRISLWVGGLVTMFSCVIGTIIGIYASYFKLLDHILMRICDSFIAIPGILLAIALITTFGTSSWNVVWALTLVFTPTVARTVRSSAVVIKEQSYIESAKVQGFSSFKILWKLILPGVISPLTVQASFIFAQAIIAEASLSFLGAGIPAPAASWGNMLQESKLVFSKAPWTMIAPGLAIIICVVSLNLLGDGIRDYIDPKIKGGNMKK